MDHRGISAVSTAVALLLERAWDPSAVEGAAPEFAAYRPRDLADPMDTGLSVLVHRVTPVTPARREPGPGAQAPAGTDVQVHLLLTGWGTSASVEQSLLGWGACVLAEHPVVGSDLLNEVVPGVCPPDVVVQLHSEDLDRAAVEPWSWLPPAMPVSLAFVTGAVHLTRR